MDGLSTAEATARLAKHGPNALPERRPDPLWRRFLRQFNSPLIFILLFALAFDLGLWLYEGAPGWPIEATANGCGGNSWKTSSIGRPSPCSRI